MNSSVLARSFASLALGLVLAMPATSHAEGGTIKGSAKFAGKVAAAAELNMKSDPFCAKGKAVDESVVVNAKGGIANVVVRIAKGAAANAAVPATEVVLDQKGCNYSPHVAVAVAGQSVAIKNSDQTLHNVHTYKGPATLFNNAQPQGFPAIKKKFKTGDVVRFKCDVHPWMTAWVVVVDNAHYAVSGADGSYTLPDVPPGKYTVEAWHEKFGSKTAEVEVKAGKPLDLNFDFK